MNMIFEALKQKAQETMAKLSGAKPQKIKKKMGRPPLGAKALSATERQRRWRAKKKEKQS